MLRKLAALLMSAILMVCSLSVTVHAAEGSAPPQVLSDSYVVMEAETGQVLIEKNIDKIEFPASITKILTVALGLEHASLDDKVTASKVAVNALEPNSSHIAIQPGEILTMKDLVYATMLPSANDAANVIAEHVSGTMEDFAVLMNAKAAELGCKNTHFVNPSGLPNDNHYTTARDMALITKYAIGVKGFMDIFGMQDTYVIPPTNKQNNARRFATEHMLLVQSKYYYEGTLGGKLGWTGEAQHTIVTLAERDGRKLICVAMKTAQKYDKFADSIALFDYCFQNFVPFSISKGQLKTFQVSNYLSGGTAENVTITGRESYPLLLHKSLSQSDIQIDYDVPEYYSDGAINPTVSFKVNSGSMYNTLGSYPMEYKTLALDVPIGQTDATVKKATFADQILGVLKMLGFILVALVALALLFGVVLVCIRLVNLLRRRQRRKHRAERQRQPEAPAPAYLSSVPNRRLPAAAPPRRSGPSSYSSSRRAGPSSYSSTHRPSSSSNRPPVRRH